MAPVAKPKLRSRKDGAAVPLDETDKKLLNLLQGDFALVPRPFAHVAAKAGLTEEEVMSRTQRLLDERSAVLEALTGIRRAGADIVITYHAKDAARWLA